MRRSGSFVEPNSNHKRKQGHPLHRKNVDTPAMREIRHLQQSSNSLIPRLPFQRLFREVLESLTPTGIKYRVQLLAIQAMQEASEIYLVQMLEDAYRCTLHRSRVTLLQKDVQLVRALRGPSDPGNR